MNVTTVVPIDASTEERLEAMESESNTRHRNATQMVDLKQIITKFTKILILSIQILHCFII